MNDLELKIPNAVRHLVREFLLTGQPNSLLPIEIMDGLHVSRLNIAGRGQDWNTYFTVPQKTFSRRFNNAINILENAIKIVTSSTTSVELDAQTEQLHAITNQINRLNQTSKEQSFYVAGGFVVGSILGFMPWRDIDVWFAPHWNETNQSWTCITGAALYPVNVMMVNDPLLCIETFDLDICKCAIKCIYANNNRTYQFILSLSCIRALLLVKSITRTIHASMSGMPRLATRLDKYIRRGLNPLFYEQLVWLKRNKTCETHRDINLTCVLHKIPKQRQAAYWIVTIRKNYISNLNFKVGDATQNLENQNQNNRLMECDPFILYPCGKGLSQQHYKNIAYTHEEIHWLLRALAGESIMLSLPGNHRLDSSLLMPTWLLDHAHLDTKNIVSLIQTKWCKAKNLGEDEQYMICCTFPVTCMVRVTDYIIPEDTLNYGPQITWYMDIGNRQMLRAAMFCSETKALGSTCAHDREENLSFQI